MGPPACSARACLVAPAEANRRSPGTGQAPGTVQAPGTFHAPSTVDVPGTIHAPGTRYAQAPGTEHEALTSGSLSPAVHRRPEASRRHRCRDPGLRLAE